MEALNAQPPSGRDAFGGFIWSSIGYFGTFVVTLLTGVLITRTLGVEEFGRYSYLTWLASTLGALASSGLPRAAARFAGAHRASGDKIRLQHMARASLLVGVGCALLLSGAMASAGVLPAPARPATYLAVALATAVSAALAVSTAVLQGSMDFRRLAWANLVGGLSLLILSVGVAVRGASALLQLTAAALASLITLTIHAALLGLMRRSSVPASSERTDGQPGWQGAFLRYWGAASLLVLIELVVWQRSEVFFLNRFSTSEQMGYYNAASSLAARVVAVALLLAPVLNAVVAGTSLEHAASLRSRYWQSCRWLALMATPALLIPAGAAGSIIPLLFGHAFQPAGLPLTILLVGGLIPAMSLPAAAVMYGTDQMAFVLGSGVVAAATTLLADRVLVPPYGATGAACASLSGQLVAVVATLILCLRPLGYRFPVASFCLALASGLLAGLLVFAVSSTWPTIWGIALSTAAGLIAYAILLRAFRVIKPSDQILVEHLEPYVPAFLRPSIGGTLRWLIPQP